MRIEDCLYIVKETGFGISSSEKKLKDFLRGQPDFYRLNIINNMILQSQKDGNSKLFRAAFRIAKSVLSEKQNVLFFLRFGFLHSDASTIKHWVEVATPKLGEKKLVKFLIKHIDVDRKSVIKARYWLSGCVAEDLLKTLDNALSI